MIVNADQIDISFREWLISMFETDTRSAPPGMVSIGELQQVSAITSGSLKVDSYAIVKEKIIDILNLGASVVIRTTRGAIIGDSEFDLTSSATKIIYDKSSGEPLLASIHNNGLVAKPLRGGAVSNIIQCNARSLFFSGKLLYAITDGEVLEISTRLKNSSLRIFGEALDRINLKSTKVFDGVLLESLMGGQFINLLTGEERVYAKFNAVDHKDNGILNAKYRNGILYLVTNKSGNYLHKLYKVSKSFKEIELSNSWISTNLEINMDVLDNGVYIAIKGESTLIAGHHSLNQTEVKELSLVDGQEELEIKSIGSKFIGFSNNKAYKLSMN